MTEERRHASSTDHRAELMRLHTFHPGDWVETSDGSVFEVACVATEWEVWPGLELISVNEGESFFTPLADVVRHDESTACPLCDILSEES